MFISLSQLESFVLIGLFPHRFSCGQLIEDKLGLRRQHLADLSGRFF